VRTTYPHDGRVRIDGPRGLRIALRIPAWTGGVTVDGVAVAPDDDGYARCCEALAAYDLRDRLGSLTVPVVAVGGTHDVAAPVERQREIAAGVPGAEYLELDAVAHLAPLEAPHTVASVVAALADRVARGPIATPVTADAATGDAGSRRSAGMAVRRTVLGDEHVDRAIERTTDVTRDFQDFITDYAWGGIWTRPGLARRDRSIAVLTALIAGRHFEELEFHLRAALRNGLTREEIVEVLLQSAVYVGVPAANTAFGVASRVLAEE
jgi:3-oxoadipate enol-lactonase/4-carboxymuconolactone decarboxylase